MLPSFSVEGTRRLRPTRREILRVGGLTAFGLGLPQLLISGEAAATKKPRREISVILLWQMGGPSQIDLYDPKPRAEAAIRGPYQPIATNVSGVHLGELLPQLARCADKFTLVRSMTSPEEDHDRGHYLVLSGRPSSPNVPQAVPPGYAAMLAHQRPMPADVPASVQLGDLLTTAPGSGAGGVLGREFDPLVVSAQQRLEGLEIPAGSDLSRVRSRKELLSTLDRTQATFEKSRQSVGAYQKLVDKAFALVTSAKAKRAFDLSEEPDRVHELYGQSVIGQRLLTARRLIEAGVRFVTAVIYSENGGWDNHAGIFQRLPLVVPPLDQANAALLIDLDERGMLENTLVITMGEFGRTPRINDAAGRDHWGRCYSLLIAGGGIARGGVLGGSDKCGAYPQDLSWSVFDMAATLYDLLGVNPHVELYPPELQSLFPDFEGRVIEELLI
jgi:uncharacterized protein (DUF1501 family)